LLSVSLPPQQPISRFNLVVRFPRFLLPLSVAFFASCDPKRTSALLRPTSMLSGSWRVYSTSPNFSPLPPSPPHSHHSTPSPAFRSSDSSLSGTSGSTKSPLRLSASFTMGSTGSWSDWYGGEESESGKRGEAEGVSGRSQSSPANAIGGAIGGLSGNGESWRSASGEGRGGAFSLFLSL
jgi:hypothetical protein